MKKLFLTSLMALAGLFATSCMQEHIEVIFDPANVTAQTLGEFTGCTLSEDGSPITAKFNEADFNVQVPVAYTLLANEAGVGFDNAKKVDASISDGRISIEQHKLNKLLGNLGATPGLEFAVDFRLDAYLVNEKGTVESTRQSSNVVTAVFTTYETEKVLDVCDVPGDYQGWAPSDYPKLFNYSGDGTIYRGVIDFKCKKEDGSASNGFKITYGGNWDNDSGNWGSPDNTADAPEAASVQLINGDASQNLVCYGGKRYYLFSFNKESLLLTKLMSFDMVGIIGLNDDWDNDVVMTYNMYRGRFWADVDVPAATSFKFRLDAAWDSNWGGSLDDLKGGGDNIDIDAGQYRIYFYMNDEVVTAAIDATMYGQEEPTIDKPEPEPVPYEGWGIIGDFNEWAADVEMTEKDGVWTGCTDITAGQNFKIRKDGAWDENRGAEGDVEPYCVTLDEPIKAVAGGKNLTVPADGFYKIVYDTAAETITVSNAFPADIWSVIGGFEASGWNNDVKMTLQEGLYRMWVSDPIALKAGDEFKVRFNRDWGVNRGSDCGTLEYGMAVEGIADGGNIKAPADGTYVIVYSETANLIYFQGWSVIGEIGGSSWDKDFVMLPMWDDEEGCLGWVSDAFAYEEGKGFKIRYDRNWDVNRGGTFVNWCENFPVENNGANISAPACSYIFASYNINEDSMYIGRADWSIIGGFNSWNGDVPMLEAEPGIYQGVVTLTEAGELKIRKDRAWDEDRGGEFSELEKEFTAVPGGSNIALEAGSYVIEYDSVNETICISSNE